MRRTEIHRDPTAAGLFVALGVIFGVMAIASLWAGRVEGWCFVVMAIVSIVAGLLGLRDTKPRVTISDTGLTIRALGRDEIPWQDIRSARIESIPRAGDSIILELKNGTRHRFYADALQLSSYALLREIRGRMLNAGSSQP